MNDIFISENINYLLHLVAFVFSLGFFNRITEHCFGFWHGKWLYDKIANCGWLYKWMYYRVVVSKNQWWKKLWFLRDGYHTFKVVPLIQGFFQVGILLSYEISTLIFITWWFAQTFGKVVITGDPKDVL